MMLDNVLKVTDPEVTIELYENDDSHYIGAIKPLYALKCFNVYTIGAKVLNIKASEAPNAIVAVINCEEK